MKKFLFLIVSILISSSSFAQKDTKEAQRDSLLEEIALKVSNLEYKMTMPERFKIYKTDNMYNLLKLDTATGRIEQLQWSLDEKSEGTMIINSEDLSLFDKEPGTFELYPTNNMYQFILLDKVLGRTWHVQWGIGSAKRWIKRIY
jgi:hypothetical protein